MSAPNERIAIIGIGCRMPPNANSLAAFWRFLTRGGNALRAIRKDRWDWRQYFDEDQNRPGKTYAPKAASLDQDLRQFDPMVFGISPREAASLDPQQRLLLEVTWEAFEDAGIPLERMSGSLTGVFIGGFCLDHLLLQTQPANRHLINAHSTGGVMMTVLSNRVSHAFNLRGPSLTLDTACSSSLVAVHSACQSLRLGECELALAGGVNAMTRPEYPIVMSKGHFLSYHGECHAFDESAAGYARGEGAGVFLLKRLDRALADGDPIHAVIRASGVNQDGHTDGISLPNSAAQDELVRSVYQRAGVDFADIDYIEAHGTGTQAGDLAELTALDRNFGKARTAKLPVGSVKTNVGHLEAAAGVAGMLKTIGILKNREIPKNLHFKNPNPRIPFADLNLEVADKQRKLPPPEEKATLCAAVNSFGYGGTNAHVVLESAPIRNFEGDGEAGTPRLVPVSASSEEALRDLAGKFAFLLGQGSTGGLDDFAYTAAFRRSHLPVRLVAVANGLETLRDQLIAASTGQAHEGVISGGRAAAASPPLVFVFTGMGPQWWGMGQELYSSEPVFAAAIDEVDSVFAALAGWSLKDAMLAGEAESRMARTELAQPANFAIQVALTRLWESHGIRPAAVIGHSVGEVASAYAAGVYTLEEAVRVSYHRSRLQQTMAGRGAMLAVGLSEPDTLKVIAEFPGVSIAAINSFNAVTVSGDADQLKEIAAKLETDGVFNKFLRVEVAYHSPQMDPLRDELLSVLVDLSPKPASTPLYSTAHGGVSDGTEWTAEYWWHNVRQPVRFAAAIAQLMEDGYSTFLEVGPHPVLGNSIKECAVTLGRKISTYTSIRRAEPEKTRFLTSLAEMYCAGVDVDWTALAPATGRFLPGPQYPWQRQEHWVESERSRMERLGLPGPVYLNRTALAPNPTWEVEINRNYFPFLFDHGVQDQTVFAGMGYVEAAIALSAAVHEKPAVMLENVSFDRVLIVDYSKLQYLVTEFDPVAGRFSIFSRTEGEEGSWQRHCRGRLLPQTNPPAESVDLESRRKSLTQSVDPSAFYEHLGRLGLHYGEWFQPVAGVMTGGDEFVLKLDASRATGEADHPLHPILFDAALQGVIFCASKDELFVPSAFDRFEYFSRPESDELFVYGKILRRTDSQIVADLWLTDPTGGIHARAQGVALQLIHTEGSRDADDMFYDLEWVPAPLESKAEPAGGCFAILADSDAAARELVAKLPEAIVIDDVAKLPDGCYQVVVLWGMNHVDEAPSAVERTNAKVIALLQALQRSKAERTDVTFVTCGARAVVAGEGVPNLAATSIAAIALVAENECEPLFCRVIDFAPGEFDASLIAAEIGAQRRGEVAYRNGVRLEPVMAARESDGAAGKVVSTSVEEAVVLDVGATGRLDSLAYQAVERVAPEPGEIELRVHTVALNYKDLLKVEGRLHPAAFEGTFNEAAFGMECAGIVTRCGEGSAFQPGDRVVAMLRDGFRTYATVPEIFATRIPANLGMDASAIPVVYLAAWRGLIQVADLQPGERVLIHHATGGVGLAAVEIARWKGAEIFATAGSEEKRTFLRENGIEHVFSSRDLDFGQRIREATNGEGIDVVIGAQTGQAMHVSVDLLRSGGRYVEIGKKDIVEDNSLPLRAFNRNLTFASVDMDRLMKERPALVREILATVFAHFESGDFSMGPVKTFPGAEIASAFHEMALSRHVGKLLVDYSSGELMVRETRGGSPIRHDGSYIVTGGTSGFGLLTARWLAECGAGRLVLVSRSGKAAAGIGDVIAELEALGASVEVLSVDVSDPAQARAMIAGASTEEFRLRGIVHGAMVLADAMLADVDEESFHRVFAPKAAGALNIADAVADVEGLEFLVFHSSVSALVGNRGQTSYIAANALLDGLAHELRSRGIPATSVNWGALAESGVVARSEHLVDILASAGITGLTNRETLAAFEEILRGSQAQTGVFKIDWKRWSEAHSKLAGDSRFRVLCAKAEAEGGDDVASQVRASLAEASKEQRLRALEDQLQDVLAATLKMAKDTVPLDRKLNELGVDSLLVLELGLGIHERIGVNFSAMEFLKGPSLQQLATMAETKLWSN